VSEGKIAYTSIQNGPWFDWGLIATFLGIDLVNKKATLIDNGSLKVNHTTLSSIGDAIVGILSKPASVKNREVRIHDFYVSQQEILKIAEEELGKFEVTNVSSSELTRTSEAAGNFEALYGLVKVATWGPTSSAAWGVEDDSKSLGLKAKDLRAEVVKVIKQLNLKP